MIDPTKTIDHEYNRLLRRQRVLQLRIDAGEHKCENCGDEYKNHVNDARCGVSVTSRGFRSSDPVELENIIAALVHLEALM